MSAHQTAWCLIPTNTFAYHHFARSQACKSLSKEQQSKLFKMKNEMGFQDETMNLFKLKLYNWNVNDALLYYQYDTFCLDYCIRKNKKYGCEKKQCQYQHSINLDDLVYGKSQQQQQDYKQGELLCLYLIYKNIYNNNPQLFNAYAVILMRTGKSQQDFLKSEKYYLKALEIDNNYSHAHNNYAILLKDKLNNYDKAEYHYTQSLKINPNNASNHANFAYFLIFQKKKYHLGLSHSEKACNLQPNLSWAHFVKAQSLHFLDKFDLSLKEYQKCLELNEKDKILSSREIKYVQKQISVLKNPMGTQNTAGKTDVENDKKQSETGDKLSIIEGIDEIIAQIIQIEEIIDSTNMNINGINKKTIKKHLSNVQNRLNYTRAKCNKIDKKDVAMDTYKSLKLKLDKLNAEIQNNNKKSQLSLLIELKKLEQETSVRKQKIEVCDFYLLFYM